MNSTGARQIFTLLVCFFLVQFTVQAQSSGSQNDQESAASTAQFSPEELQQLVAPIALYPDALVAQILAASTYPTQIVEADRWMQDHTGLHGDELAKEVNKQSWDPSVKALTQFPSVLENMDKNLSWTSSLGDAYTNQPQDVTNAVQTLRQQARNAGHLDSNAQENVTTQGDTIVIEPVDPDVVYVPAYDPWLVYGFPIGAYPGWYPVPGIFWDGIGLSFGFGFDVGFFGGFGWGWPHWGYNWDDHRAFYDHHAFVSRSLDFGQEGFHHGDLGRAGFTHDSGFHADSAFHAQPGTRSSVFGGFDHGGVVRGFSSRGRSSMGGGFGGFHGGGFGGGGFHGGGRR